MIHPAGRQPSVLQSKECSVPTTPAGVSQKMAP
jgi:hypothetical protein